MRRGLIAELLRPMEHDSCHLNGICREASRELTALRRILAAIRSQAHNLPCTATADSIASMAEHGLKLDSQG